MIALLDIDSHALQVVSTPFYAHSALLQAPSCPARFVVHCVQILSLSSSRDLSSLACTCRALRDLIFEDEGFSEPLW